LVPTEARKLSASTLGSRKDPTKVVGRAARLESHITRFDGNQSQCSIDDVSIPQAKFGAIARTPSSTSDPDTLLQGLTPPTPNLPSTPTSWTTFAARYIEHVPSIMDVMSFLRSRSRRPSTSPWSSTPIYRLEVINSRGQNVDPSDITRDRIRRQLRLLFIYPLVYIGLWVIPFVGNIFRYDTLSDTPVILKVLVNIIMTVQCAVDCLVFSIREKPWRHIPGSSGGFWESLVFWKGGESCSARQQSWPGKSRAEMAAEARAAYRRRDDEIASRIRGTERNGNARRERAERSWWDATPGIDGTVSPAIEEVDPLDISGKGPS
jgi:G protein-coupled receptor GPR1